MGKTLEDFVKLWNEEKESKNINETLIKDPYNVNLYNYIRSKTAETTGVDPITDPEGNPVHLTPDQYRELGKAIYLTNRKKAIEFSEKNLDSILEEINDEQLIKIVSFIKPTNNKNYEDIIKRVKEYQEINQLLALYSSGDERAEKAALAAMYQNKKLIEIIKEDLSNMEKDGKKVMTDEKEIGIWTNALLYLLPTNPIYIIKAYQNKSNKIESEIKKFKRSKLTNYVKEAISKNSEPDQAYEAIYNIIAAKK